ncbi:M1 family metallopeptidase [Mobilicoccus sp.]|uniref:M1 family metallopeptidase n=1 Tax=Mobilicoccus sp. TaxID=2034349 RepID=UPI00289C92F9|nr:M1 family metallopeptidase [Mobilicoccus sp.]
MRPTSVVHRGRAAIAVATAFGLATITGVATGAAPAAAGTPAAAAPSVAESTPTSASVPAPVAARHTTRGHLPPTPGAPGIGDSYYPLYGNGGYDVRHYGIKVAYDPATDLLTGTTTITAKATKNLSRFDLDLVLRATKVTVDGRPARFRQVKGQELVVTPARPVRAGRDMVVTVTYAGVPSATQPFEWTPWVKNADGAVAIGEPEIAAWWFPSNDHPLDKARYDISLTVPKGVEAISNGVLRSQRFGRTTDTWNWRVRTPMASYLAFAAIGQFDVVKGETKSGLPSLNAYAVGGGEAGQRARRDIGRTPEVVDWLSRVFGPYPFEAVGGVAPVGKFGFALENQTRPVYSPKFWAKGQNMGVVVHENAHQWFGNSVSVHHWKDIWLNEGFASYAEWLWDEQHGGDSAQKTFEAEYAKQPADAAFWRVVVADPGPDNQFDGAVYDRGAMAVHALRNRIGDAAFFHLVRTWTAKHRHGNATVEEFEAMAEKISGQELSPFFRVWLRTASRPEPTVANGFPARS